MATGMAEDQAQSKEEHKDFFISYTRADRRWAEWIAWHLEEAGYRTVLQAWDFHAGGNFVLDMDTATRQSERTIAVLSPDYFASRFTPSEWAAAFRRDPKGEQGILLPIRVRSCDVEGLLGPISYLDLVDRSEQEALATLLAEVPRQRRKPVQAPSFPSTSKPDRFPGALPALWMVPFRHNRLFTGRETILLHLHETLTRGKRVALTQVINGLGGIGKTQIAIEYAYRYFSEYQAVLWMRADSQQSILSSFLEMANLLQLPEQKEQETALIVSAVQRWYRSHPGWLLIVDNADELDLVQPFLPEGQGQIILTSRSQITRGIADETLPLDVMDAEEGALLLLRCAKRVRSDLSLEAISEQELAEAKKLVDTLGGLPLALDQAGAYIEETGCSVAAYLTLYQEQHSRLLKQRGSLAKDSPQSVATTWSLSFKKVKQANLTATDLLQLCAFLAPDAIPEEVITKGAASLGPRLSPVASNPINLDKAIAALRAYSLVRRNAAEKTLSVHRLVQAVQRESMTAEKQKQWKQRAVQAVNASYPDVQDISQWDACERWLPHALVCATWIEQESINMADAASLLNRTGYYLDDRARYAEAEPLYQRALSIRVQQLGPHHPDTAQSLNNLALLYQAQGKYEQAEPLYQRALAIREQQLGPQHPATAQSLNNLAALYQDQGKYEQAEPLYQRALAIREQQLGPQHPSTATSLNNLAGLYQDQGKYSQAEPLYQRALAIREQQLGPQHPSTATSLNNLAGLYQAQGKDEQAEPLYQRALQIYEQQLGPDHPDTATSLNNLAQLYRTQGKYEQAEPLYQRALAICEQQLGLQHPDTAQSLNNLAALYRAQGKYEQAEPLYQRALAIHEQQLGPQHPTTQTIRANYAHLLHTMGRGAEAAALDQP